MASIFITGSTDGLGKMAARQLIENGHEVFLHARNPSRAKDARKGLPGAADVLIGDLSDLEATRKLAADANALGTFDVVIHNAAVLRTDAKTILTVNTLSPYLLTCLMHRPKRFVYMSSNDHSWGRMQIDEIGKDEPDIRYADTKLQVAALALAVARKWPDVLSNAVDPGWVPTKMGGKGAPDDLQQGHTTQVWLAEGKGAAADMTGKYLHHKKVTDIKAVARDPKQQEALLAACARVTGEEFPGGDS